MDRAGFHQAAGSKRALRAKQVAAVFGGPNVKAGYTQTSATVYQHQSMLRTVMEALRLSNPPGDAASAPSMAEFFLQK